MTTGGDSRSSPFRLGHVRRCQPNRVLQERLSSGLPELAAYIKTLVWVGTEYFGVSAVTLGPIGLLIAVGVRPNRPTKLYGEIVSGDLPEGAWHGSWSYFKACMS